MPIILQGLRINALMMEDGVTSHAFSPAEVPSMDFGFQSSASAGPQYFALSPRAQLPVSSGTITVMGVNHKWRIANGSLVLEPVELVPPPPPHHPSFSLAAPPHVALSAYPTVPPKYPFVGSSPTPRPPSFSGASGHQVSAQARFAINLHHLVLQLLPRLQARQPLGLLVFLQLPLQLQTVASLHCESLS